MRKYPKSLIKSKIPYLGLKNKIVSVKPEILLKKCVDSRGTSSFYKERDIFILRYLPLALSIASGFSLIGPYRSEIPSVAIETLIIAIDRLIEKKEHPNIGAYLNLTIRGEIIDYIKREGRLRKKEALFDLYDDDNDNPIHERFFSYSEENKIIARDIIRFASSGIKQLKGINNVFSCSNILLMKMEGYKNREICDQIKKETGNRVSTQRVDQMTHRIYSVLKSCCQ